jgi:hypothetical protein
LLILNNPCPQSNERVEPLLEVMQRLGFGQVWRDILSGLLLTSSTHVLLNGHRASTITHQRGLQQGDPLSLMLFVLVIDGLGQLFSKADEEGLLQPLSSRLLQHRISLFADDVVLFIHLVGEDINVTLDILQLFGGASGLYNNNQKSNVYPIRCHEEDLEVVHHFWPCQIAGFPCKYLGLPLSLHKLKKEQAQPIVVKIANQLPRWKADLLTKAGRRVLVQSVMTGMLIYIAMAVDLPSSTVKDIDRIRKGFLWRGRKEVRGHCLVAWEKVCRPLELGGLGIFSIYELGWALKMRWALLQKTEPNRPWASLPLHVPRKN